MGSSTSEAISPNANENFLKMTALPNENLLMASCSIQTQAELSKWASNLLKLAKVKNYPILLPLEFKTISQTPCGEQSILEIKYECFYVNFSDEIESRRKRQNHFEEEELWYLLLTLVEAAQSSHEISTNLGDIKPSNILLNKEGQIRILTKLSVPSFVDSYDRQNPNSSLYSPEELLNRKKGYKSNKSNYLLSESFSIGMVVLAAGSLTTVSSLYDYQKNEINMVQFNKIIKYWQQFSFYSQINRSKYSYSLKLKEMVLNLLRFEPEKRICSLQVSKILQNYRHEIMTLQKFNIEDHLLDVTQRNSHQKSITHHLQSRRRSEIKDPNNTSFLSPSFNNSHDVSFQIQIPNISSEVYSSSGKKNASLMSAASNKQKLSVTAYFPDRQEPK